MKISENILGGLGANVGGVLVHDVEHRGHQLLDPSQAVALGVGSVWRSLLASGPEGGVSMTRRPRSGFDPPEQSLGEARVALRRKGTPRCEGGEGGEGRG